MIKKIKDKACTLVSNLDVHTLEVIKKSSASMIVKISGMAAGLFVSIFLGQTIGPEGLGIINLANQIVSLLLVLTMFGMGHVVVKNIAIAKEKNDWQNIANNLFTSSVFNGSLAFIFAVLGILAAPILAKNIFNEPNLETPLIIALAMIIPQTFSRILASGLIGFRKVWQSNLVDQALSTWFVGISLYVLYVLRTNINVVNVAILYAIGRLLVTLVMTIYWKRLFIFKQKKQWMLRPMLRMATPLLLAMTTDIISASSDTIMLGWLSNTFEVGIYSVAHRIATLTSFLLLISNSAIAPKIAALYATGKIKEMELMIKQINKILILVACLVFLFFIFAGSYILPFWGSEFGTAYWPLVILSIGQFFNISTGCVGLVLVMCGQEKLVGKISLIFLLLNLPLNYILILKYGALGAAIATALTVSISMITRLYFVKVRVGLSPIPWINKL